MRLLFFGPLSALGILAGLVACASTSSPSTGFGPDGGGSTSAGGSTGLASGGAGGTRSDAGQADTRHEPGAVVSFLGDQDYPD